MHLDSRDDRFLSAQLRAGNERAFERLFQDEYANLCAFANRIVNAPATAEDIVQGVFLKVWATRTSLPELRSVRAYLFRATRNSALDHMKHEAVTREWQESSIEHEPSSAESADVALVRAEGHHALDAAVRRLSPRAQQTVIMRWLHEMSHAEIAEALGISIKGVEIQITRALKTLRQHLGHQD